MLPYLATHKGIIPSHSRNFVSKGWGYEDWIWNNEEYCGKVLFVKKGKECSWHYHEKKDETFYLQDGEITVWYGDTDDLAKANIVNLRPGDAFHIPRGMRHRFFGRLDSHIFEFSTEHFDSDSIRVQPGD